MMRTWFLRVTTAATLIVAAATTAHAQRTGQIRGTVTDSVAGHPIPAVQISIPGTSIGAISNTEGQFIVRGVPAGTVTLRAQRLGYAPVERIVTVTAGGTTTVDFRISQSAVTLQEVVAVGYGTQRREQITSAVSSVDTSQFNQSPPRDAASLISGKVPGLAVVAPSGDPRSGNEILLRGITTITGSRSPLVLVDGIPGDLNTVSPRDIESISVLKDASAAAIYGSRASNGVILITTKQYDGKPPSFRYDGYASLQTIAREPGFLTASDYRRLIAQGYKFQDLGYNTNWENAVLRKPVSARHALSVTGGTLNSHYTASVDYENTQGIFLRSDNQSLTGRIGLGQLMYNGKVETDFELLSRVHDYFMGPDFNYTWRQALIRNPTDRIVDSTGAWQERSGYFYVNPLGLIQADNGAYEGRDLRMHGTIKAHPIDHLTTSLMVGTERSGAQTGDATTFEHVNTTQSGLSGTASRNASNEVDHILEGTGTYDASLGRNDVTLLGGYSYQDFENDGFGAYNYGFPTDLFGYNQLQQGSALSTGHASMSSYKTSYRLIGFFSRLNYDWDNRFLLMGSLRYEGNSRFGAAHKWGLFPAVSAGWQLANEQFVKDRLPWMNQLKVRVGYGITGIAPSSSYLSLVSYGYGSKFLYNGQWVSGLSPTSNPNPDLRWEQKSELNTGVDFAVLNSRLSGTLDVYQSDNRNMLYNYSVPVPPYLFGTMLANVGHMENQGIEASLAWDVIRRRNLTWTTSANWSTNRNKLVSLSNSVYHAADFFATGYTGEPIQQSTHRVQVGQPIGGFWGWKSVDIDSTGAWVVLDSSGNRISIRNAKEKDKRWLGNGLPRQYAAWNNTVRWGNADLAVNMRGAFGFQILNFQRMFYENPTILQYNMLKSAFDKVYGKRTVNYDLAYVSYYIENGDYWKVDNVTLGYTVPARLLGPLSTSVTGARVYLAGTHLLTLTGYKGMDPEVTTYGSSDPLSPGDDNRDTYPTTRMFTAGVSLTF